MGPKRVAVTRPQAQNDALCQELEKLGFSTLPCPLIVITPCYDPRKLQQIFSKMENFDWVCFTSANGVQLALDFAEKENLLDQFQKTKFACIGPATENELHRRGLKAACMPKTYQAEGLLEEFKSLDVQNRNILLLRAKDARKILRTGLQIQGANVTEINLYESLPNREGMKTLETHLKNQNVDCVTFTSSSTVRVFKKVLNSLNDELNPQIKLASIGPITSEELRRQGLPVHIQAEISTTESLVDAITKFFEN